MERELLWELMCQFGREKRVVLCVLAIDMQRFGVFMCEHESCDLASYFRCYSAYMGLLYLKCM